LTGTPRVRRRECEVLLERIEGRLSTIAPAERAAAERTADALRRLVAETARACATDRARVRAAVHFFASRGKARIPAGRHASVPTAFRRSTGRPARSLDDDVRVVNEIIQDLRKSEPAQVVG
jgi:hypothetical protein